jgi:hypothetical protein
MCRDNGVRLICNEDTSVLKNGLRADTAIYRGGLSLCEKREWHKLGFVVDTSLRTPTVDAYLKPVRTNASNTAGLAADAGDNDKAKHHHGQLQQGYKLIPMVQESYGRMGRQGAAFLKQLAAHSAACKGGSCSQIVRRRSMVHASLRTQMSTALAFEVSERVFAYVRGARSQYGRTIAPVSGLLF